MGSVPMGNAPHLISNIQEFHYINSLKNFYSTIFDSEIRCKRSRRLDEKKDHKKIFPKQSYTKFSIFKLQRKKFLFHIYILNSFHML